MNIIAVDDNKFALDELVNDLSIVRPNDSVKSFLRPGDAIEYIDNECKLLDVAFLDVEMPVISGIEIAIRIKIKFPRTVIIFVSAYPQYAIEAFKIHANGYLLKPASREMIENELNALSQPFISIPHGRVRAQTFGNFELYVDEKPVKFARTKSKELITYLIDRRGALCTMNGLAAVLLDECGDEKVQQSHIRHMISDVRNSLEKVGAAGIIHKERNGIAVNTQEIDCDYYRMLEGEPTAVNQFFGEYMSNYSWGESTIGEIIKTLSR